jgi:hypothetical protein
MRRPHCRLNQYLICGYSLGNIGAWWAFNAAATIHAQTNLEHSFAANPQQQTVLIKATLSVLVKH